MNKVDIDCHEVTTISSCKWYFIIIHLFVPYVECWSWFTTWVRFAISTLIASSDSFIQTLPRVDIDLLSVGPFIILVVFLSYVLVIRMIHPFKFLSQMLVHALVYHIFHILETCPSFWRLWWILLCNYNDYKSKSVSSLCQLLELWTVCFEASVDIDYWTGERASMFWYS